MTLTTNPAGLAELIALRVPRADPEDPDAIGIITDGSGNVIGLRGSRGAAITLNQSDPLPVVRKPAAATGQVAASPCKLRLVKCLTGAAVTITLRDSVTQTQAGADVASPVVWLSPAMNAGDEIVLPLEFNTGCHATLSGGTFEVGV